jgi:hypothetical protein
VLSPTNRRHCRCHNAKKPGWSPDFSMLYGLIRAVFRSFHGSGTSLAEQAKQTREN